MFALHKVAFPIATESHAPLTPILTVVVGVYRLDIFFSWWWYAWFPWYRLQNLWHVLFPVADKPTVIRFDPSRGVPIRAWTCLCLGSLVHHHQLIDPESPESSQFKLPIHHDHNRWVGGYLHLLKSNQKSGYLQSSSWRSKQPPHLRS